MSKIEVKTPQIADKYLKELIDFNLDFINKIDNNPHYVKKFTIAVDMLDALRAFNKEREIQMGQAATAINGLEALVKSQASQITDLGNQLTAANAKPVLDQADLDAITSANTFIAAGGVPPATAPDVPPAP